MGMRCSRRPTEWVLKNDRRAVEGGKRELMRG